MANHLTLEERDRIAELRHRGADQKEIAVALGRSRATISRELRRNRTRTTMPPKLSGKRNGGGGSVLCPARWTIPSSMKPFALA